MKKLLFFLGALALIGGLFFSCTPTEEKIINNMLSNEQIEILEDLGMPLNSGDNPSDII